MIENGTIHEVRVRGKGSQAAVAAASGATVITVMDASDFNEAGGTLRVSVFDSSLSTETTDLLPYVSADPETDTITLGVTPVQVPIAVGDRVNVWPLAYEKEAVIQLYDAEEPITATVIHPISDLLPEGIREPGLGEIAQAELGSDHRWRLINLVAKEPTIQSVNYSQAESTGWMMDSESTQFQNVSVAESLGVQYIAANEVSLGGLDLQTDVLDPQPRGVVYYANISSGTATAQISTTTTMAFLFNLGILPPNRRYMVLCSFHFQASVANDAFDFALKYDTTGAVLSTASQGNNILDGSITRWVAPASGDSGVKMMGYFESSSSWTAIVNQVPIYMGLTVARIIGTGTGNVYQGSSNRSLQLQVVDVGSTLTGYSNVWSQLSKAAGTADPTPGATFTTEYVATGSSSYGGNNSQWTTVGAFDCYQGKLNATDGRTKSLVLFDSTKIRADLTGATVTACKLTFSVHFAYFSAGMDVRVAAHNNSTIPSTFAQPSTEIGNRPFSAAGATYSISVGTSFGTSLKNGTARGVAFFAPTDSLNYYGYIYGSAAASPPKLTITYTK
jgi:hypothetical protein